MGMHECGGEKSFTVFGISLGHPCECDHEQREHQENCCKDKKVVVQADHSNKYVQKAIFEKKSTFQEYLPIAHFNFLSKVCSKSVKNTFHKLERPPNSSPPLYILHNTFLI